MYDFLSLIMWLVFNLVNVQTTNYVYPRGLNKSWVSIYNVMEMMMQNRTMDSSSTTLNPTGKPKNFSKTWGVLGIPCHRWYEDGNRNENIFTTINEMNCTSYMSHTYHNNSFLFKPKLYNYTMSELLHFRKMKLESKFKSHEFNERVFVKRIKSEPIQQYKLQKDGKRNRDNIKHQRKTVRFCFWLTFLKCYLSKVYTIFRDIFFQDSEEEINYYNEVGTKTIEAPFEEALTED